MKPDENLRSGLTLTDLCTLLGLSPDDYAGFVTVLIPASWEGTPTSATPAMLSDAPGPGALVTVLGYCIQALGSRWQIESPDSEWEE